MEGKRFIHTLRLQNFLSYGGEGEEIELQPLNVLIGPNASGKSNLIEAIGLLKATPTDLAAAIRKGGGISEWLWKGEKEPPIAKIEVTIEYSPTAFLLYKLDFTAAKQRLEIVNETIGKDYFNEKDDDDFFYYHYQRDSGFISVGEMEQRPGENLIPNLSMLSQIKEAYLHPGLTYLGNHFYDICLYRDWHIGRNSESRKPQQADLPEHPLLEDGSNLGLFLNNLQYQLGSRPVIEKLKKFYDEAEELSVKIYGGTVQIFIREEGLIRPIPATRLSDGTLRYLFLLALLLDPTPPPLICIEEPEIGLHPDILPTIAEMLIEASQRTQLIVTTHSDVLVSALSPESVVVCERNAQGSHLRRLDSDLLKEWLKEFSLGHLWRMGEIGGTRW
ncbi:MAG: AAA family ATPase [Symploca sp. SIO2E6]|nr:AAA family ATPase [Symploca sp. SIO2E6]